jgi:hypothetical protein
MSKFYPDVRDEDGMEAGANWGAMAAIGLGFLALLGAVPSFYAVVRSAGIEGAEGFLLINAILLGAIVPSALFCFFAAWRFMQRRGMVVGVVLAVLSVIDIVGKFVRIALAAVPFWYLALLPLEALILYGLLHGIRAARAAKRRGALAETDLGEVFG